MQKLARFVLVVTGGPDAGARVIVGDLPLLVGRKPDADLVLSDARVSRHHLRIVASAGGIAASVIENGRPILFEGAAVKSTEIRVGGVFRVGMTELTVQDVAAEEPQPQRSFSADTRTLITSEPRSRYFRAIAALSDALDDAVDDAEVAQVFGHWARASVGATGTSVVDGDRAPSPALARLASERPRDLHGELAPDGASTNVIVPAHGRDRLWLAVTFPGAPNGVTEDTRRLLVLAGKLCGAHRGGLRALRVVNEDRDSLRQSAIGSARGFLGESDAARDVASLMPRIADSDMTVLLLGETGTGKSFVARLLHETSPRSGEPLRTINCATLGSLLEDELFGHERGAFTGADRIRIGALEAVGRGTLFLDEIGELPLASQAKILRALDERQFERVGSNRSIAFQGRIVAATNRDLPEMIKRGEFREDLFHRLNGFPIRIRPLRERGADVTLLAQQFLADFVATRARVRVTGFAPDALEAIRGYGWPGNVRELRSAIEYALVRADSRHIELVDLPEGVRNVARTMRVDDPFTVRLPADSGWLDEKNLESALRVAGGNKKRAAELMGINRATLYKKLKQEPEPR